MAGMATEWVDVAARRIREVVMESAGCAATELAWVASLPDDGTPESITVARTRALLEAGRGTRW
jgi:hypothetical protein